MEHLSPDSIAWVLAAFAAAIVALWGFVVVIVMAYRRDARADRKRCEDANTKLGEEIKAVRTEQTGKLADALESSAVALHAATTAQHQGNAVLDRVCRRLENLPCAKDAAEKKPEAVTPLGQAHA